MMSETLELAKALISCASITPADGGCQRILADRLAALGFRVEPMGKGQVHNLWARRGSGGPLLVFAGHTDVVPPGPSEQWDSPPFEPTIRDGRLYGRGAADMKGSLAAMVVAMEQFIQRHPRHRGSLGMLLTSDEEGPATEGTRHVIDNLVARGEQITWCLVGEPSSHRRLGDTIKNGRRGSLTCELTIHGKQGHVAYPELADNPIHAFAPALAALCTTRWGETTDCFPATTMQVANIHAGTGAGNVIPGSLFIQFNFRYGNETTAEALKRRVEDLLLKHALRYEAHWHSSGEPFVTAEGDLVQAVVGAIEAITGEAPELSTAGGTSDARFIAPTGAEVVELGPVNASIHQVNESVAVEELEALRQIYQNVLERLLG